MHSEKENIQQLLFPSHHRFSAAMTVFFSSVFLFISSLWTCPFTIQPIYPTLIPMIIFPRSIIGSSSYHYDVILIFWKGIVIPFF